MYFHTPEKSVFEKHLTLFDIFIINGISPHQLSKYKCHESQTVFPFTIHILYLLLSAEMTRFLNAMLFTLTRGRNLRRKPLEKLSCFNFQWKQPLYQNNLKHIVLFFNFSRAIDVISYAITAKNIFYASPPQKKIQKLQVLPNEILRVLKFCYTQLMFLFLTFEI